VVLTAVALLCAYLTWTRDRTQVQNESVVALDLNKRDISGLIYEDENRTVNIEKRSTPDGDPYAWVSVRSRSKQLLTNPLQGPNPHGGPMPPPGAGHPGMPPGPPPGVSPVSPGHPGPAAVPPPIPPRPGVIPGKVPAKGGDKALAGKDGPGPQPAAAKPVPGAPPAAVPPPAPPAASTPPAAPAPAPIHEVKETITTKEFRGNEQADKLFELFAPMRVVRTLGVIDDVKAKELGLDNSKKSLTVIAKGQPVKFTLGSNAYGSGDVYARDPQGQVYLLGHKLVADFEFAESRMMERRLHRFERSEFDRVEITVNTASGPKTRTLIQKNPEDNANFYYADATSPDKRDDTLRNWMDKILRMAINDYVNKGEEPAAAQPGSPLMGDIVTMHFFKGKKPVGEATFSRSPNKGGQVEYFARTETTLGLVRLLTPTSESAIQDAEKW
jgi:hypothetical protein